MSLFTMLFIFGIFGIAFGLFGIWLHSDKVKEKYGIGKE